MKTELEIYKNAFRLAETSCETAKKEALRVYLINTAKYRIGDIIETKTRIIKIERVYNDSWGNEVPKICYSGKALNKNLTEKKNGSTGYANEYNTNCPITLISRGVNV